MSEMMKHERYDPELVIEMAKAGVGIEEICRYAHDLLDRGEILELIRRLWEVASIEDEMERAAGLGSQLQREVREPLPLDC